MFCKYADIFGKPNTGVHSYRIFNIAIIDFLLTFLLAYYIHKTYNYDLIKVLLFLLILSIFIHKLFCVETTLTKLFFN